MTIANDALSARLRIAACGTYADMRPAYTALWDVMDACSDDLAREVVFETARRMFREYAFEAGHRAHLVNARWYMLTRGR
jgi:hypothetical protein